MEPGRRVDLINECARTLSGRGWADIDFILSQFDLPTTDRWEGAGEAFGYVRDMLGSRNATDEAIIALHDYLHASPTHDPDEEPWGTSTCRVFISHLAMKREDATALKTGLEAWGIDGFVAHRDINPGAEWIRVIIAALRSSDALVALLHEGVKESDWCDQEIGVALGRSIPVIPVRFHLNPYGLFGVFQAIPWPTSTEHPERELAERLVKILGDDKRTKDRVQSAVVHRLENARSFAEANRCARWLVDQEAVLSREQLQRVRAAQASNDQVGRAFDVEDAMKELEARLPPEPPEPEPEPPWASWGEGDEPF